MTFQSEPHKFCLIHGNQQLLVEETVKTLIEQRLDGREKEWSLERFNALEMLKITGESGKNSLDDFLISCETLPMLSDRKVIQLDNIELIKKPTSKSSNTTAAKLYNSLEKTLKNPPEHLWFIFTSPAMRELDFSKPLYRNIKNGGRIQKFVAYDNNSPLNWVMQRGQQKGLPVSSDSARLLIDIVGNDLTDLDHELEKLSLYLSGTMISENTIKEHIRGHKHFSVFRMTEALSRKDLLPALEILDQQLQAAPREHVRLFSLIVLQFRRLLLIHSMFEQFYKEAEIIGKISLPPFLSKQVMAQARNFTCQELQNIYTELAMLDLRVKFQSSIAPLILQDLFQRICSGQFQNSANNKSAKS
ncbi:MAG: DNA polymerase III subunit delta [SAR324 cluster bacterium]|nr:DNA polymerase III subunit delta [SAR324 cluster bacterium]MBL7035873.1 DNA polymerase III subunit delta [SAR324 cluster bacterium]